MRPLLCLFLFGSSLFGYGQREVATFPGGQSALQAHIRNELKYPVDALEMGIEGTVMISLRIDSLGKISLVQLSRGICVQLDSEALRIAYTLPKWIPGTQPERDGCTEVEIGIPFYNPKLRGASVPKTFLRYRQAILAKNGPEAFACLHDHSVSYFDTLASKIKYGGRAGLLSSTPYEIATILSVRQLASKKQINGLNGKNLYIFLIEHNLIGKSSAGQERPILYSLREGVAQLLFQDDYSIYMLQHDADWQIDLVREMDLLNASIREYAASQQKDLLDFIVESVEKQIKQRLATSVWEAPISAD